MKILNDHIHRRVASGVAAGAVVFSIIASLIWFYVSYHQEVKLAQHQIEQLVETVKQNTAISLYLKNKELAGEVLDGLKNHDLVSGAIIETKDNQILSQTTDSHTVIQIKPIEFTIKSPFKPHNFIGKLIIIPNQTAIDSSAASHAKAQVILLILYSTGIVLLTLTIVNKILTRPLKKIAEDFHEITPGENKRIHVPFLYHNNELGKLVIDINTLLDAVNQQIDKERVLREETENLSQKFRLIFERASAGIGLLDSHHQLVVANPALLKLLGQTYVLDTNSLQQTSFLHYFLEPELIQNYIEEFWIRPGQQFAAIDQQLKHKNNKSDRWVHCLLSKVENAANPENNLLEVVMYDITERAEREQSIIFQAEHDPLTQLLNRRATMTKLEALLGETDLKQRHLAILMIDLDGFKKVNDTHGHDAGDRVIVEVSRRIKRFFRGSDVVSRWGGDEFLIAFSYSPTYETAVNDITEDLQQEIARPIDISHELKATVGSSIGISLFPAHDTNIDGLIEKADESMYHVKNTGRNYYYFYSTNTDISFPSS